MKIKKAIVMFFLLIISNNLFAENKKMVVCKSVVDLRTKPVDPDYKLQNRKINYPVFYNEVQSIECGCFSKHEENPFQDTQLLFGDNLILEEDCGDWLKVRVLEQLEYRQCKWACKVGYIKKDEAEFVREFHFCNSVVTKQWANLYNDDLSEVCFKVSIGTKLFASGSSDYLDYYFVFLLDEELYLIKKEDVLMRGVDDVSIFIEKIRLSLLKSMMLFLNFPYSWGGRSGYDEDQKEQQVEVDCSSFVNLVYRVNGFEIPRDASDQYFFSNKIDGDKVQCGDLVFFENSRRNGRMKHVLIYIGDGKLVEMTGYSSFKCRIISDIDLLGKSINEIKCGEELNREKVYFGSFFYINDVEAWRNFDLNLVSKMRSLFWIGYIEGMS